MATSIPTYNQQDFANQAIKVKDLDASGNVSITGTLAVTGAVTNTDLDAGASGTAGTVDVYPATASKGKIQIAAADSAGNTTTTVTNASQAGARTYTIPDAGASASFVMTEGAQTVNGIKTLGSAPVLPSGGLSANGSAVTSAELAVLGSATSANAGTGKAVILGTTGAVTIAGTATMAAATMSGTLSTTGAYTPTGGVAAAGGYSVSPRNCHTGGNPASVSTDFTDYTVVTTETIRAEVFVPANCTCTGVAVMIGSTNTGNGQAWLLDSTGTVITGAATASTALGTADSYQRIPWSGGAITLKGPATYWVAVQGNNVGGKFNTHTIGNFGADKQTGTTFGTITVAAAPTTFTTALGPVASLY